MPRSSGYSGEDARQRETLENALAVLVRMEYLHPITCLRVRQAHDRTGMGALLGPALADLDEMGASVRVAKSHVITALARLVEG